MDFTDKIQSAGFWCHCLRAKLETPHAIWWYRARDVDCIWEIFFLRAFDISCHFVYVKTFSLPALFRFVWRFFFTKFVIFKLLLNAPLCFCWEIYSFSCPWLRRVCLRKILCFALSREILTVSLFIYVCMYVCYHGLTKISTQAKTLLK